MVVMMVMTAQMMEKMLNIKICIAENVMLKVMIVMMMTALMIELMLKRFVPVQSEMLVNQMSSQQ